jgi:hypothetical protein
MNPMHSSTIASSASSYLERDDHVDVVRLLSYVRDLPALLTGVDGA